MGNHAKQLKPELHEEQKPGLFSFIEKVGNKLPDPFLLFIYLIGFLMVISAILSSLHVSVVDPSRRNRL